MKEIRIRLTDIYLIPAWLLAKVPDFQYTKEFNEFNRKYSRGARAVNYVAAFVLWALVFTLARVFLF